MSFQATEIFRPDYDNRLVFIPVQWRQSQEGLISRITLVAAHGMYGWPFCTLYDSDSEDSVYVSIVKTMRMAKLRPGHFIWVSTYQHLDTLVVIGIVKPDYDDFGKPSRTKAMFSKWHLFAPRLIQGQFQDDSWRILINSTEWVNGHDITTLAWEKCGIDYTLSVYDIRKRNTLSSISNKFQGTITNNETRVLIREILGVSKYTVEQDTNTNQDELIAS